MPYVFSTKYEYKYGNYEIDFQDAVNKFPFLSDRMVSGEILATYVENKVTLIRRPFKCKVTQVDQKAKWVGRITEPNPLKEKGVPPCELCVALYKYEEFRDNQTVELPIMESEVIKGSTWSYFDDIVKRISKGEEIRIMIETTTFHHGVKSLADTLRDAYLSFEEERYSHTKTSCRKILENLRNQSKEWKTIDGSESICDKLKSVFNSVYSFASSGGPHEGISTRDETEFVLKAVAGVLFYVNSLLKSDRIVLTQEQSG
jgi:hypothetical protein